MRTHRTLIAFAAAVAAALALLVWHSAGTAAGAQNNIKIYEIVHFVETKGRITNTPHAFDITVYAHYVGTSKLTLDFILYDERTGLPIPGACMSPRRCAFVFGGGAPARQTIHFEDLVEFPSNNVVLGVAQLRVTGPDDPAKLLMDVYLVNSHSDTRDLSFEVLPLHTPF